MRSLRNTTAVALTALAATGAMASGATAANCPDSPLRPTVEGNYPAGCYVYEMVSPADKGSGEAGGGLDLGPVISETGDRAYFSADSVFAGAPHLFQINGFASSRGAGSWQTKSVSAFLPSIVPTDLMSPDLPANMMADGVSVDATKFVIGSNRDPETGDLVPSRIYKVDVTTGERVRLTPDPVAGPPRVEINNVVGSATDGTPDLSTVLVGSGAILTPDADIPGLTEWDLKLYHHADGQLQLASYAPNGQPQKGATVHQQDDIVGGPRRQVRNSVSADGRTYWYIQSDGFSTFAGYPLFRGEAGVQSSVRVNASENTGATVPLGGAIFHAASPDGGQAYFTSQQALVTGAPSTTTSEIGQLYLYTHSANPVADQNLTLVSEDDEPADGTATTIDRVLGVTPDASTVYFSTRNQLVAGETTAAGSKIYRWRNGTLEFLRLLPGNVPTKSTSQVSDDGRYLLFLLQDPAAPAVPPQVHRYDSSTDELACVSCPPPGVARDEVEFARLPAAGWSTNRPGRWLSNDGRVTFATKVGLLTQDTNGLLDSYTWKDGRLSLVSSGRGNRDSRLAGASADGRSIFFFTNEQLSGWDRDTRQDLYVARVDGGLPEPNERPAEVCSGDTCQGSWTPAPPAPVVGSVTFTGAGNVVAPPWTSAEPRVSKVKAVRGRTATLRVRVPAEGTVRAAGNRLLRTTRRASKAQTLRVRVRLSTLGDRLRKRRGSVRVNVSVRFAPAEGRATTVKVPVTFRATTKNKGNSSSSRTASTKKGGR